MDIQFITQQQQSLQTLCFHYILNQTSKSRPLLTNSIIMHLACHPQVGLYGIYEVCKRIIQENQVQSSNHNSNNNKHESSSSNSYSEKQYRKNIATLLKDITNKCPALISKCQPQHLSSIIQYSSKHAFCAVIGNEFINLIKSILQKMAHPIPSINAGIQNMMMDPKMTVGTYRQVTRLHLYAILYIILQGKSQTELNTGYLQKVIRLVQDEKDPRNISLVFQIYLLILAKSSTNQLLPLHRRIFDNLQMYYPIDFQGDSQKHNIHLNSIADLLDQCLSQPIFASDVRGLLMIKMGAAPIAKYISTFNKCKPYIKGDMCTDIDKQDREFWTALLIRTGQDGYLQEEYDQSTNYKLADLVVQLLNRLAQKHKPIPIFGYSSILTWLSKTFVNNILISNQNSKHANTLMVILKNVMGKQACGHHVQVMIGSYLVTEFINKCKDDRGDVIYKLGILIPIIENVSSYLDIEKMGLLILTLAQIFHKTDKQEPQPRLMVLKLYMLLAWSPAYMKMIQQTNIMQSCIAELSNKKTVSVNTKIAQSKIIKAYIDFLVQLYHNDDKVCQAIYQIDSSLGDAKIYGLLTLANKKNQQSINTLIDMLETNNMEHDRNFKEVVTVLKTFKPGASLTLLSKLFINNVSTQTELKQLSDLAVQKFTTLIQQSDQSDSQFVQLMKKFATIGSQNNCVPHILMWYLIKSAWRPYLTCEMSQQYIKTQFTQIEKVIKLKEEGINKDLYIKLCAFYNWSLKGLKLQSPNLVNSQIQIHKSYITQIHRMLPVTLQHTYTVQQCKQWPTLTHYSWSISHSTGNKNNIRSDLIPLLPPAILAAEGSRILPYILHQHKIGILAKVLKSLSQQTIINQIIPFLVKYLANTHPNTNPNTIKLTDKSNSNDTQVDKSNQNIVQCNRMLSDLFERSKTSQDIHRSLVVNKGKILVAIQQNLLQHSKRRVRQSARTIFSIYNVLK